MLAYTYNSIEEAEVAVEAMNNHWGFEVSPESTLYFNKEIIFYHALERCWVIFYNEWNDFLGDPTEVFDI